MIRRPLAFISCLFLISVLILLKLHPIRGNPPDIPEGKIISLEGRLKDRQKKNDSCILILSGVSSYGSKDTSVSVYLDKKYQSLSELPPLGSTVTVKGKFRTFEMASNPGQFDPVTYYHIRGIEFRLSDAGIIEKSSSYDPLRETLFLFRLRLSSVYERLLPPEESGILKAMILGDRTSLDPDIKSLYQESGIAHALSISGLHISILGYGLYRLLKRVGLNRYGAAVFCMVFIFLYSLMVGGSTSTVRAVIMFSTCMLADLTGRTYDLFSALSLSLMMILFTDPLYIYDAGFMLSFGSVSGIACLSPVLKEILPWGDKRIFSGLIASLSVSLSILPVTLYFFYEVPVYSVFLNLLVLPLMGVLVVSAVIAVLTGLIFLPAGVPAAYLCRAVLKIYERGCSLCIDLPGNRIIAGRPDLIRILVYYALLLVFLLFHKKKAVRFLPVILPCILLLRFNPGVAYTMLDIGQGDCNILNIGGKTVMIDCGSSSVREPGKNRAVPFLKFNGENRIDVAVLTHTDSDHINGFEEIAEGGERAGIRIKHLILPGIREPDRKYEELVKMAGDRGIVVSFINAGDRFSVGNMDFRCLGPEKGFSSADPNEYSVVLEASYGGLRILFTGDIQGEGEKRMTEHLEGTGKVTVLKVAHHGSRYSTPCEVLEKINPSISLISAGRRNRYGHPHKELLERLKETGSGIYVTANEGAITVKSDGKSLSLTGFLNRCQK